MTDEDFEYLKDLLEELSEWELITIHSYLRNTYSENFIEIKELFNVNESENFVIPSNQLLTYVELEYQTRNLN